MKRFIVLFLFLENVTAGLSQALPFPYGGIIPQYTNVDVRWKASKHPWPKELWTYQMIPTKFSATTVSNLISLGGFTGKDRWYFTADGISYSAADRNLRISYAEGEIEYNGGRPHYSETNLAKDVPGTNQLFQLTTNFIPKLGIDTSEIPKTKGGRFQIRSSEPSHTFYSIGETTITNVEFRSASFGRLIDGVECDHTVGSCTISFGEHSQINGLSLYWRNVQRDKHYSAITPDQIVQWIRSGKIALPKGAYILGGNSAPIDWSAAKRITVNDATAHYWGEFFLGEREHQPIFPSSVAPYAILDSTVDFGKTKLNVKILCPVIDESKQLK
jgi:hypothetical protein